MANLEILYIEGKLVAKTPAEWVEHFREDAMRVPADQAVDVLIRARMVAPRSKFVRSCAKFLERNGYLTEKQIKVLESIEE